MKCPSCGTNIMPYYRFCWQCGRRLTYEDRYTPEYRRGLQDKKRGGGE